MAAWVQQAAIVMLAMNLDQIGSDLAQQGGGGGLAVDEAPASAIGLHLTPHDQRLTRFDRDARLVENGGQAAVGGGGLETGGNDGLSRAVADQPAVAAPTQRQPERVEQDRFARPGLTGQNAEAPAEIQVQSLDQDDITNGQRGQHGARYKAKCGAMLSPVAKMIPICSGGGRSLRNLIPLPQGEGDQRSWWRGARVARMGVLATGTPLRQACGPQPSAAGEESWLT